MTDLWITQLSRFEQRATTRENGMRYIAGVIYGALGIAALVNGQIGAGLAVLAYTAYLVIGTGRKWIIY